MAELLQTVRAETASGSVRIRPVGDGDAGRWNAFLVGCGRGNFYQRYEWQTTNRDVLGHDVLSLMAERDGDVVGVLPLVHVRSLLFGSILSSMPFVNLGGPAGVDTEIEDALVREACRRADGLDCHYMEVRSKRPLADLPAVSSKVSMTVPLDGGPEAAWENLSGKHRKQVRRAQEAGLEFRQGGLDLLDDFYRLMELSWRGLGTPLYRKSYFATIIERLDPDMRLTVAYHQDVPVATAFDGFFVDMVGGMWAAVDPAHRQLQPNYSLYWELIRDAAERGFRQFHLGRSTANSGAAQFKAKWNAQPEPLHWSYHLVRADDIPGLNPDNPRFLMAIRAWRRLPLAITRRAGPALARLIP
jgi:FemAB-related protein (PEP-CTERM system-associated)